MKVKEKPRWKAIWESEGVSTHEVLTEEDFLLL